MPVLLVHLQLIVCVCEKSADSTHKLRFLLVHAITVIDQRLCAVARLTTDDADVGTVVSSFVPNQTFEVNEGASAIWKAACEVIASLVELR